MRSSHTLPLLFTTALASIHDLSPRETTSAANAEESYLNSVCLPPVTSGTIPPCVEITTIQELCAPNGTLPLDYLAHAECMCGGSFFSNWVGCLQCDYVHGARSPAEVTAFNSLITSASDILCTGTPTTDFAAIFTSLGGPFVQGTDTQTSDQFPSQTAVSLYFTASGEQGPGAITGSATAATGSVVKTTAPSSKVATSGTTKDVSSGTSTSVAPGSASSTSTSKAGAAPTNGMGGLLGVVVGGVVMAAM